MKRGLMVMCFAVMIFAGRLADAAIINGQFVPDDLVGTYKTYRLVFVTSGATLGNSGDINTYNTFLQNQVAGTMLDDSTGIYDWQAVMSTFGPTGAVTAAGQVGSHTATSEEWAGIWNTSNGILNNNSQWGALVATSEATLLPGAPSGDYLSAAVAYDQNGSFSEKYVWTGSTPQGNTLQLGPYSGAVGSTAGSGYSGLGLSSAQDTDWLQKGYVLNGTVGLPFLAGVYGISGELVAVPEPSTIALWSVCAGAVGLVAWRKRRKSS